MFIKIRSDFCLLSDYKYTCCGIVYGEWLIDLCCLQFGILVVLYKVIYSISIFVEMKKLALEKTTAEIQLYMEGLSALELVTYFKLFSQNALSSYGQ